MSELDPVLLAPVLALRSADWVPQVRRRARLACRERLTRSPVATFSALAPVAFGLRRRSSGDWLVSALESLLHEGPLDVLAAAIAAADRRRRIAFQVAVRTHRLTADQMLRAALTDSDLHIRVSCADEVFRAARSSGDTEIVRRLLSRRTAAIRGEAVHILGLAGDIGPARTALTDRRPLVRAMAQATLRRAGQSPAVHYRALVTGGQPPDATAIAGLGETGERADVELLRSGLRHPGPRGRAETVRALRRLGESSPELLLPLLTDPAPAVVRQVTVSLGSRASALDEHVLRHLLDREQPHHVRVAAYRLLHGWDTWTRLTVDLQLVDDPLPALRHRARHDLISWLRGEAATTYSMPTPDRARQLRALLAEAESALPAEQLRALRFHLGLNR